MERNILSNAAVAKKNATVLVISDDPQSARMWAYGLKQSNLDTCLAGFSEKTLGIWMDEFPDLIVLEDYNAQADVLEFCRRMRGDAAVPILLLTSRNDEAYLLEAYAAGVDDCVPHPVSPRLFMAKVTAWLRRSHMVPAAALDEIQVSGFHLDPDYKQVILPDGQAVKLTNLETRLLYLLMNHPGWIMETNYLIDRVWGFFGRGDSALLKNVVYRLRRKIEPNPSQPRYLITESTLGYRFMPPGDCSTANPPPLSGEADHSLGGIPPTERSMPGSSQPAAHQPAGAASEEPPVRLRGTGQLHPDSLPNRE